MEAIDKSQALERLENDEELYSEIVAVFLEDTPVQVENLRRAIEEGDGATALRLAHSLKSAAGNIGANAMREVAFKMEVAAKSGGSAGAAPLMSQLEVECERVVRYFKEK